MDYIKSAGGIEQESDYPYSSYYGTTGTCSADSSLAQVKLSSYTVIAGRTPSTKETNMASYVQSTGPLSICVDASVWSSYTGGILSACGTGINHAVQAGDV